ncbi:dual specificity protein phosphatase 3-like [Babylonia areolata]|uniref:dual specificity protein phosphatase 3-like n=1 Tax=Babylonia areolata TaxID=304850 RepID=UPI003FCF3C87
MATASETSAELDLKTLHDVRNFLRTCNDGCTAPPKPGAFTLFNFPAVPKNSYDLVFEGIYLGQASAALRLDVLKSLGVTHVVNASLGTKFNQTNTDADFYKDAGIDFHGIPALDIMTFKILPYLRPAAQFIHKAHQEKGVVYVHCQQGVSRSASVVLAYLMLHWDMSLMTAVRTIRQKREIFPNEGFVKQLCMLEMEIRKGAAS